MKDEFLPQYAANALLDLMSDATLIRNAPTFGLDAVAVKNLQYCHHAHLAVIEMLRQGVHVMLPPNGEIYRGNAHGGEMPNAAECESLGGLPAPVTVFEYDYTHKAVPTTEKPDVTSAPRRITVAVDDKQLQKKGEAHDDIVYLFSVYYHERFKKWVLYPAVLGLWQPLRVEQSNRSQGEWDWNMTCFLRDLETGRVRDPNDRQLREWAGEFRSDITAVLQCCHSLRAGAGFKTRTEPSASRRWKFEKKGAGGFKYHELTLPARLGGGRMRGAWQGGTHDSPGYHFRRHHIRNFSDGTITFVRHCWVGERKKGEVEKTYKVVVP